MPWVCSKIIGDGSEESPFRTQAQQYGLPIRNADAIPVDPKTGQPLLPYAMLEVPDAKALEAEAGCFVFPPNKELGFAEKSDMAAKLVEQECRVSIADATQVDAVILKALMEVVEAQKPGEARI